jgi:rhamnosyltransferase
MPGIENKAENSGRDISAMTSGTNLLATITVTYNPDLPVLARQLEQLPANVLKIIVDNASHPELTAKIRDWVSGRSDLRLLENADNRGLATALNQGGRYALQAAPERRYLLLLDQDTEPGDAGVERLFAAFQRLSAVHPKLGCVGPRLIDVDTTLDHGFHQISGWRWVRRHPSVESLEPVPVANLNGSGTLVSSAFFAELGGLDESLFIDHVDTEWSFRVLASGHLLYGIPDICFKHRMGVTGLRFWLFGWHVWPYRSPSRHYYLFRNAVRLLHMRHVPLVWKFLAPVKLTATLVLHLFFDRARWAQVGQMIRGVRDGFRS